MGTGFADMRGPQGVVVVREVVAQYAVFSKDFPCVASRRPTSCACCFVESFRTAGRVGGQFWTVTLIMRLKSLNLHGFKSFADTTEFAFHPGVTAIVGPNGCGKSNLVDAVRWVLGETSAKALRGGEMADVIFNGTDKRKPLGMAEVTLVFADCEEALKVDYNEVALTRRVFRDGKSEYRINDKLCRLKDIQNLLMDTGIGRTAYSIMEQGKIDMLLSSKPEDRRNVFEEAAGITRFKVQKREALRKLDYTESNLVRVSDIIQELQRQRDSLQRQANKARRYRELLDDLTTLDTHWAHRQYRELEAERAELKNSIESLVEAEESCREEIEGRSGDLSAKRGQLEGLESEFHELSQQQMSLRSKIQNSQGRMEFNRERSEELGRFIEQNRSAIEDTNAKTAAQRDALAQAEENLHDLASRLDSQRSELAAAEEADRAVRNRRAEIQRRLLEAQARRQQLISQLANLEAARNAKLEQRESDAQRLAALEEEKSTLEGEGSQYEAQCKEWEAAIAQEGRLWILVRRSASWWKTPCASSARSSRKNGSGCGISSERSTPRARGSTWCRSGSNKVRVSRRARKASCGAWTNRRLSRILSEACWVHSSM